MFAHVFSEPYMYDYWEECNSRLNASKSDDEEKEEPPIFGEEDDEVEFEAGLDAEVEDDVEQLTPEDIHIFLQNESVAAVERYSQQVLDEHAQHMNMFFDTEIGAYSFYIEYAQLCGFSIKKAGNYKGKSTGDEVGSRRTY